MEIVNMLFQEKLILHINNQKVIIVVKENYSHGEISLCIEAPKAISVNREEIYIQKRDKMKKS